MAINIKLQGDRGEYIACEFLMTKGYELVATNWSCKSGEIDLIMRAGSILVFVEVRRRSSTLYGKGYETVAYQKQRKIINTAYYYQQKMNYWGDIRFDVVSIEDRPDDTTEVEHIEYAFEAIG